jgi:hypothetical protein
MSASVVAERRVGLRGHAVGAAEQVEVVDEGGAEIDLQRLEHALGRHAEHVGLVAVDVGEDARRAGVEQGEDLRRGPGVWLALPMMSPTPGRSAW